MFPAAFTLLPLPGLTTTDTPPAHTGPQTPVQQVADKPLAKAGPVSPGMVCTRMGKPELPPVNWSGEALFHVLATVKGGRVTATEIQALRGGMDARTRRALQGAIDTALKDSYECPGEHRFEQEFQFSVN